MPFPVVLLCGPTEVRWLSEVLAHHNRDLAVAAVPDAAALAVHAATAPAGTRLIAFCTGSVVPAAVLERLGAPAYNIHPASPAYPGRHPIPFALYDGAERFGATAHVMEERVDSGPIVGAVEFAVPPGADHGWLAERAYRAAVRLFLALAPALARPEPLAPVALSWGPRRCSQKALEALCALPPDIGAAELERRVRAVAGTPEARPHLTLHGRRFGLAAG